MTRTRRSLAAFKRLVAGTALSVMLLSAPSHSFAASSDDDQHFDARVQGYTPDAELKGGGNGMMWVVMILLGVVSVSVLFKSANRSHLD